VTLFTRRAERCRPCPVGAGCAGLFSDPVSDAGFYPLSRGEFVGCLPPDACLGGANASLAMAALTATDSGAVSQLSCAPTYQGPRCADCRYVFVSARESIVDDVGS
jgi:hypothetical protein